jgi:hypothetical protein
MCVESHLRDLLESGFEVAVVRDAVAAPKIPEGDGYQAAIINFRYMANGLWTTEQTVQFLGAGKPNSSRGEGHVDDPTAHSVAGVGTR